MRPFSPHINRAIRIKIWAWKMFTDVHLGNCYVNCVRKFGDRYNLKNHVQFCTTGFKQYKISDFLVDSVQFWTFRTRVTNSLVKKNFKVDGFLSSITGRRTESSSLHTLPVYPLRYTYTYVYRIVIIFFYLLLLLLFLQRFRYCLLWRGLEDEREK